METEPMLWLRSLNKSDVLRYPVAPIMNLIYPFPCRFAEMPVLHKGTRLGTLKLNQVPREATGMAVPDYPVCDVLAPESHFGENESAVSMSIEPVEQVGL